MSEWISVDSKLPEIDQPVIYYFETLGMFIGKYHGPDEYDGMPCFGGKSGFLCGDVTHWMPLPEPPVKQED